MNATTNENFARFEVVTETRYGQMLPSKCRQFFNDERSARDYAESIRQNVSEVVVVRRNDDGSSTVIGQ